MPAGQRITLVAAGAGAGITATFDTPIGGMMFAIELMMPEVTARTFLPVAPATGTATFVGRVFLGQLPACAVPVLMPLGSDPGAALLLALCALLGALTGLAATGFIRALVLAEDLFAPIPERYSRHVVGMLLVGFVMYGLHQRFGEYYVDGVGYATIQSILEGRLAATGLLALLFLAKLVATSLSLGSGSKRG